TVVYRVPTRAIGAFTFSFNGTYMYRYDVQNLDGSFSSTNGMRTAIVNGNGGVIPRWRHYATLDWRIAPWNFALAWQYQSRYKDAVGNLEDPSDPSFVPRYVSDYSLVHFYSSYTVLFSKNLKLTVGIRNIFDKSPQYS